MITAWSLYYALDNYHDAIVRIKSEISDFNAVGNNEFVRCMTAGELSQFLWDRNASANLLANFLLAIGAPGKSIFKMTAGAVLKHTFRSFHDWTLERMYKNGILDDYEDENALVGLKVYSMNAVKLGLYGAYNILPADEVCNDVTHPNSPMNLVAHVASSSQIDLSWVDSQNETLYRLEYSLDGINYKPIDISKAADTTTWSIGYLSSSTTYYFRLYAVNSAGSNYSEVQATTLSASLPTPTGLYATPECDGNTSGIKLTWNGVSGASKYEVYRGDNWIHTTGSVPSFHNTLGLSPGDSYDYHVRAKSNTTVSEYAGPVSAIAPNCSSSVDLSISGRVTENGNGLQGVTISLAGPVIDSTMTDTSGYYIFTGAQNGQYTVIPSKPGYSFTPPSRVFYVNDSNATLVDFTATAVAAEKHTLTVVKTGTGSGTVMSSPPGINCGTTCSSDTYDFEEGLVNLIPSAGSGSAFAGWSGACDGPDVCTINMDGDKTAYANFNSTSVGGKPSVTTGSAQVLSATSAQLHGTINPNGLTTYGYFQYGKTNAYDNSTNSVYLGSTPGNQAFTQTVSSLTPGTTYHYQVVAVNDADTVDGSDRTFRTQDTADYYISDVRALLYLSGQFVEVTLVPLGSTLKLEADVQFTGTNVPGTTINYYLSTDSNITSNDILLATGGCSLSDPNSFICSSSITVQNIPVGNYYLGAIVDPNNLVTETNENNNVYQYKPLALNNDCVQGLNGTVHVYATLNGSPWNAGFQVNLLGSYGWSNLAFFHNGTALPRSAQCGEITVDGNSMEGAPPDSSLVSITPANPQALAVGGTITFTLNYESNNTPKPDLGIDGMGWCADVDCQTGNIGGSIELVGIPHNYQGNAASGPFRMGFYWSTDEVYSPSDIFIGSLSFGSLNPRTRDNTYDQTNPVTFPIGNSLSPGQYYVIAVVDDNNQVPELNENNNTKASHAAITLQ